MGRLSGSSIAYLDMQVLHAGLLPIGPCPPSRRMPVDFRDHEMLCILLKASCILEFIGSNILIPVEFGMYHEDFGQDRPEWWWVSMDKRFSSLDIGKSCICGCSLQVIRATRAIPTRFFVALWFAARNRCCAIVIILSWATFILFQTRSA